MISDLELVRTFLAVVEAGSFTAAAPGVYRSQAAVSQQIRRLEAQVGAPLLERGRREVTLSNAGRRLLPHARQLLAASEEARMAAHGIDHRSLRIGVPDDLAALVMPALAGLGASDATLAFEVVAGTTRDLYASIPAQLDVVIGLAIPRLQDGTELARLRLRWFGHWNGRGSVPLALCREGCLLRRQALAALGRAGTAWHLCVTATHVGVVEAAIAAGMAVGPLLEAVAPAGLPGATALPAPGDIGIRLYADRRMDARLLGQLAAAVRQQLGAGVMRGKSTKTRTSIAGSGGKSQRDGRARKQASSRHAGSAGSPSHPPRSQRAASRAK
jgi:DNA-binding transcriptional LysR family regulator